MEKITFVNGTTPALNAANLNQIQTNVENAITEVENTVNGIVESGSNADGNYIKYADGTMICTKTVSRTVSLSATFGNVYYSAVYTLGDWAQPFINAPFFQSVNIITDYEIWCNANFRGTATALPSRVDIYCGGARTDAPIILDIMAIGKWK